MVRATALTSIFALIGLWTACADTCDVSSSVNRFPARASTSARSASNVSSLFSLISRRCTNRAPRPQGCGAFRFLGRRRMRRSAARDAIGRPRHRSPWALLGTRFGCRVCDWAESVRISPEPGFDRLELGRDPRNRHRVKLAACLIRS